MMMEQKKNEKENIKNAENRMCLPCVTMSHLFSCIFVLLLYWSEKKRWNDFFWWDGRVCAWTKKHRNMRSKINIRMNLRLHSILPSRQAMHMCWWCVPMWMIFIGIRYTFFHCLLHDDLPNAFFVVPNSFRRKRNRFLFMDLLHACYLAWNKYLLLVLMLCTGKMYDREVSNHANLLQILPNAVFKSHILSNVATFTREILLQTE